MHGRIKADDSFFIFINKTIYVIDILLCIIYTFKQLIPRVTHNDIMFSRELLARGSVYKRFELCELDFKLKIKVKLIYKQV